MEVPPRLWLPPNGNAARNKERPGSSPGPCFVKMECRGQATPPSHRECCPYRKLQLSYRALHAERNSAFTPETISSLNLNGNCYDYLRQGISARISGGVVWRTWNLKVTFLHLRLSTKTTVNGRSSLTPMEKRKRPVSIPPGTWPTEALSLRTRCGKLMGALMAH
jgi:hypothetical protein